MNDNLYEPANIKKGGKKTTEATLELEFIYGSSKKNTKGNIMMTNCEGNLIYPAAAVGVVYNPKTHKQQFKVEHRDDIVCIDMDKSKRIVATGECGDKDKVIIWDSVTLETLGELPTWKYFNPGGVLGVAFNAENSDILAVLGGTKDNTTLVLYDWKQERVLAKRQSFVKAVTYAFVFIDFDTMVWCGHGGIKFIDYDEKKKEFTIKNGVVTMDGGKLQPFLTAIGTPEGGAIVGTKSGWLYYYRGNRLVHKEKAHKGNVRSLYRLNDKQFISVGKDGMVNHYAFTGKETFEKQQEINLGDAARSVAGNETDVYVNEYDGDIWHINLKTTEKKKILFGHAKKDAELWGIAMVPNTPYFITGCDDKRVIVMDRDQHVAVNEKKMKGRIRAVDCCATTKKVALGSMGGNVTLYNVDDLIQEGQKAKKVLSIDVSKQNNRPVNYVAFSPNGKMVAVASADSNVYIFSAKTGKLKHKLTGHSSSVLQLDWSENSMHVRSVSRAYELLYWDIKKGCLDTGYVEEGDTITYATDRCLLSWTTRGVWDMSEYNDGTDINAIDTFGELVATADDLGRVSLGRYPTLKNSWPMKRYYGHCSHVTNVRFSCSGSHVFSTGGADLCVFQFKINS
mmetsp:Transcript_786/g.1222  ORF Transcript_786/g.1222 Transcript_786/m.1222 type:complete len:623 (-) Transcript_786:230-2098(-)